MNRSFPRTRLLSLAVLVAAARNAPAPRSLAQDRPAQHPTVVEGALGAALDAHMSALAALGVSGSVLVSKKGAVVLCKGYGLADREQGVANGPDTLFDIGSVTKQFTAAAVLKLEEQGKLKLGDPLSKFVGDVPKDKSAITLHHLLTHTSGLPRGVPVGSATTERGALVKAALATELASKPGEEFLYANAGFELLAAVVEIASGETFEEFVRAQLFRPAKLERTTFLQAADAGAARCAVGYEGAKRIGAASQGWYSWGLRGAGGVLSSVVELERWWRALEGDAVLSAVSRRKLFTRGLSGYACGWWVREDDELGRVIHHEGTTRGFEASMAHHDGPGTLVILLCNDRETCKPTASSLARVAAGLQVSAPPAAAALRPGRLELCEGIYVAGKDAELVVRAVGARLALEPSPEAVVLFATGREAKTLSKDVGLTKRIAEIVLRLKTGDAKGLESLVTTKYPGWNRTLVVVWQRWCAERGAYQRHAVLGTERTGDILRSFVHVEFAERGLVLEMGFRDERLSAFEVDAGLPWGPAFVARTENEFAWMDPKAYGARRFELLFERDARGRATMLTVGSGALRPLVAKRKP